MRWDVDARALYSYPASGRGGSHGLYLGRFPDRRLASHTEAGFRVDPDEPIEPAADGCPAAWSRSPFAESVAHYVRRRADGGARVDRPAFTRARWQVQEAVEYLEAEQERWHGYRAEVDQKRWRLQQANKPKGDKRGAR